MIQKYAGSDCPNDPTRPEQGVIVRGVGNGAGPDYVPVSQATRLRPLSGDSRPGVKAAPKLQTCEGDDGFYTGRTTYPRPVT